jgi:hypothetical protein
MLGSLVRANRLLLQDIRMRVRRLELQEPPRSLPPPPPTAEPDLDPERSAERIGR